MTTSPPRALSADDRGVQLRARPAWSYDPTRDAIVRVFQFQDFDEAFGFMTRVALEATRLDHHPEWSNVYNRVEIHLRTHDAGGVSALDFALAARIDRIL